MTSDNEIPEWMVELGAKAIYNKEVIRKPMPACRIAAKAVLSALPIMKMIEVISFINDRINHNGNTTEQFLSALEIKARAVLDEINNLRGEG